MRLGTFIAERRMDILARVKRAQLARGARAWHACDPEGAVPLILDRLVAELAGHASRMLAAREAGAALPPSGVVPASGGALSILGLGASPEPVRGAAARCREQLLRGMTVGQVVYHYGDICQAITSEARASGIVITTRDFQVLNRCLDDAIAEDVTEHARLHDDDVAREERLRRGFLAHELRGHLGTAMLANHLVKTGAADADGTVQAILARSLGGLRELIDRSVAETRLPESARQRERVRVAGLVTELATDASLDLRRRGVRLEVDCSEDAPLIDVDRHLFTAALSNVLRNAIKFTRPLTLVTFCVRATEDQVSISVEDECGGLSPEATRELFSPYRQFGLNRDGLGLGLAISRQAVEGDGGTISVRNVPDKGCVFTIVMPRVDQARTAGDSHGAESREATHGAGEPPSSVRWVRRA